MSEPLSRVPVLTGVELDKIEHVLAGDDGLSPHHRAEFDTLIAAIREAWAERETLAAQWGLLKIDLHHREKEICCLKAKLAEARAELVWWKQTDLGAAELAEIERLTQERDEARECAHGLASRIREYRHLGLHDQLKELAAWEIDCPWLKGKA